MSGSAFGRRCRTLLAALPAAALTLATTAALAGPTAAALDVDPEPSAPSVRMQEFDPADFADRAAALPAGLVEAVRRDLDMAPEEYLAAAAATRQAGQVIAALGDTVRSAWLDGQTLHVAVTGRSAVAAAGKTGAEVQVGDVLADALAAARAQNQLAYIDRTAGRVVAVGADVRGEPVSQPRLSARSAEHRGGSGFAVSEPLTHHLCSTGFAGTDEDGNPLLLTAGHCAAGTDGLLGSEVKELAPAPPLAAGTGADWPDLVGHEFGEYLPDSIAFGGGHDAALITVDDDGTVLPEVVAWDADTDPDIDPEADAGDIGALAVYDSIDAIAGAPVCTTGAGSGWTCGQVLDAQATVPVSGQTVTGFLTDACVLPGDSGGAALIGGYALGINSGSTWPGPSCADGDPAADGHDIAVGYPVSGGTDNVEALYGEQWELLVHVGTPVVTAPADGASTGPSPTIIGTADAAPGTVVTVDIEDGPTLEAEVGPTGRWSAPVGETLEPGRYEYEVTAEFRPATGEHAVTSAEEATGTFEVAETADLSVSWPAPGHVNTDGRPRFEGTGEPGATVSLTVGGDEVASTAVEEDGTWLLRVDTGRPAGRFDAVLTQHLPGVSTASPETAGTSTPDDDTGDAAVTLANLGVAPRSPMVAGPLRTSADAAAEVLTGVGVPGATVTVRVAPSGEDPASAPELQTSADEDGAWELRLDAPLPAGRHVVVATQSVDDLTSEPSNPVVLDVAAPPTRATGGLESTAAQDDPAAAGRGPARGVLVAAAALLVGGAVAGAATWRRRHAS